jgi:hypothetical protein
MIRPTAKLQSACSQSFLRTLCGLLEARRYERGWYHEAVVTDAHADIAVLTAAGLIEDTAAESHPTNQEESEHDDRTDYAADARD